MIKKKVLGKRVFHFTNYMSSMLNLVEIKNILIVGGSQSAAEIALDLLKTHPNIYITMVIRNFGLRSKDHSPFTHRAMHNSYTDVFYQLPFHKQRKWRQDLKYTNYSASDQDVLDDLFEYLYICKVRKEKPHFSLLTNKNIETVEEKDHHIAIDFKDTLTEQTEHSLFDAVILATGFRELGIGENPETFPSAIKNLESFYKQNPHNFCHINRNYSLYPIKNNTPPIFLNGLCESTHGLGDAGTYSLLSLRTKYIAKAIMQHL